MQPEPIEPDSAQLEPDSAQEDTEAILSRRRFLIKSGLASAGLAVAGCEKGGKTDQTNAPGPMSKPHKPGICLKVAGPKPDAAVSRPCLSVPDMTPDKPMRPRVCLKVRPPEPMRDPGGRKAMVCLSQPKPPRKKRPTPPKPPKPRKRRARICLSEAID